MRRRIGIFIGEAAATYQRVVLDAIFTKAKELNYDVFVFASFGLYSDDILYAQGEMGMIELPDLSTLDGIIVCDDTFDIVGMDVALEKRLKKEAKCPVVYLRVPKEKFYNILIDDVKAMEDVTRHFVYDHGFRDICFMKGKKEYQDAKDRYQGFLNVMDEAGIGVTEHMVFQGNYWRDKGKEAVDWFMEGREKYPQAIICSNDFMALSICEELKRRGISVPEEVCVSGYDNLEEARLYIPSLTTINIPFDKMAIKAVEMIDNVCNGREQQRVEKVQTEMVYRKSCGCGMQEEYTEWPEMSRKIYIQHTQIQRIVFMTTELQGAYEEKDYLRIAENYAKNINHKKMCFCFCDEESRGENDFYSKNMILKRILTENQRATECEEKFSRSELIPKTFLNEDEPEAYFLFSIHYKTKCFGYTGIILDEKEWLDSFLQAYLVVLANAIEDSRMHQEVLGLEEIKKIYMLDPLTGIYNRRGYENKLRELYDNLSDDKRYLSIVSIDMDGLKYINDNFGHAEGDEALARLAIVMRSLADKDEVCARIGGDEFVMLLLSESRDRHLNFPVLFDKAIKEEAERFGKPYPFGASLGICCINEEKNLPLMACIQMADKRMYMQKKNKKEKEASVSEG